MLRDVPCVSHRKMMGEYVLYADGIVFGGVYDDRFLLKDVPAARAAFPQEEIPYEGAKPMLLVDCERPARVAEVVASMLPQLPKRHALEQRPHFTTESPLRPLGRRCGSTRGTRKERAPCRGP